MDLKKPKTCLLTVTNQCALHCKMCQLWKLDTAKDEISIGDCKNFVDSLAQWNPEPMEVHLIGGESLVKKGILELISHIRQKGSRVVMTSSGYTIDEAMARGLVDAGLSMLNLSLESLSPSVHDSLRGREGCLKRVMGAIEHFRRIGKKEMRLGINTIITASNLKDIAELATWVEKDGLLDSLYFMAVMRPFGAELDWEWFKKDSYKELWPADFSKVEKALEKIIELKKSFRKIENPVGQLQSFKGYFKNPDQFIKSKRCNVSDQAVNVNALGDVYLCFFMEKLGNIRTDNIAKLWHSEKAADIRKQMNHCRRNCELVVNCYYENER